MRQLARFEDEGTANTLSDALYVEGIESRVDATRDGGFLLWVHDEAKMERAKELLELFERTPDDIRFKKARREAAARREEAEREVAQVEKRQVNIRERWKAQRGVGTFTLGLIVVCVGVFVMTDLAGRDDIAEWLYIDTHAGLSEVLYGRFQDVRSGQVWRLVTPALMHGGFLHILFNMWWLKDLGTAVEHRQSTLFLVIFFLITAVASNVLQYLLSGPNFVGMSGVVYALFGYIWIRGRFDASSGYALSQAAVAIMVGWYVLCWTGLVGPIANWAHTGGLVAGAAWGFAASKLRR